MRNNITISKIWLSKNDILSLYPIGLSTYKKRIKKLRETKYHKHTRLIRKELNNSNLKTTIERQIHYSILNEIFGDVRTPSLENIPKLNKWINLNKWDWFCNIIPSKSYPIELRRKMEYFFYRLKRNKLILSKPILFYTIEKNSADEYFHCHFLLKTGENNIDKPFIETLLKDICEQNNRLETRISVRPYNYEVFQTRGSSYSAKDFSIGYDLLK
jgi:hypothetical protein